jgi:hypothetical protein
MFDFHYHFAIEFLVGKEDGAKKGRVGAVGSQGGAPRHGRAVAVWLDEGDIAWLTEIAHRSTGGMHRETKGRHVPCETARRGHLRPLTGEVHSTYVEDVAAWFLDTNYNGKTFKISQAFFPGDPDAWKKLQLALKATIPEETFAPMRGTLSFPFEPGERNGIIVKVLDFRGNKVVRVTSFTGV